jgi:transcriptional regulator with XRE-family HTH domain
MVAMTDLRAALKAKGKRQKDLAVACGVGEPTVSRWVRWVRSGGAEGVPVPARALPVISDVSGVPLADLLPQREPAAA